MAICHYHPERLGVGVCMRCKVVICAACCTRLDGINYCHACLKVLGRAKEPPSSKRASVAAIAIATLGIVTLVFLGIGCLTQGMLAPSP